MKQSLLELTQDILGAMEDDEVNSIGDTVSSLSVAQVIQNVYDEMVVQLDLPHNDALMTLESLSDVDRPNYLHMPESLKKIHWIKYNNKRVDYLTPEDFVEWSLKLTDGIEVEDFNGVVLKISNNRDPRFWTTFDDEYIVMDAFDLDIGSTLLSSKSMAWVNKLPHLPLNDDSIPDLPEHLFPTLKATAKARCFVNFKQTSNNAEERAARQGMSRWMNDQFRDNRRPPYNRTPNYGRPRR